MSTIKKWLKNSFYFLLSSLVLLTAILSFLLLTTPGIYTSVKLANLFLPGKLSISKAEGQLAKKFHLEKLFYQDAAIKLQLDDLSLNWHLSSLLKKKIIIRALSADQVHLFFPEKNIETNSTTKALPQSEEKPFQLPVLPVDVRLDSLDLGQIIIHQDKSEQRLKNLHLQFELTDKQWRIPTFTLEKQSVKLAVHAHLTPEFPYPLQANLEINSSGKSPDQLQGALEINGDSQWLKWQGRLQKPANIILTGSLENTEKIQSLITWDSLNWPLGKKPNIQTKRGFIRVSGSLSAPEITGQTDFTRPLPGKMQLSLNSHQGEQMLQLLLKGPNANIHAQMNYAADAKQKLNAHFDGDIKQLEQLGYEGLDTLKFSGQVHTNEQDQLKLHCQSEAVYWQHPFKFQADYDQKSLLVTANLGANQIHIEGQLPYQWQIHGSITEPALLHPSLKNLKTALTLKGNIQSADQGQFELLIRPGQYQLADKPNLPPLSFQGGSLEAELNPQGLKAHSLLSIDADKQLRWQLNLPGFNLGKGYDPNQPLDSEFIVNIHSLAFLDSLSEQLENAQGELFVRLLNKGSFRQPNPRAEIRLSNAQVQLPKLEQTLTNSQLHFETNGQHWQLQGGIGIEQQRLTLQGKGQMSPEFVGEIQMKGDNLHIINTKDYSLYATTELNIQIKKLLTNIRGSIKIPKALISPQRFVESVSLSDDVVFQSDDSDDAPSKLALALNISMGDDVALDIQGLKGKLAGDIRITQQTQGGINASGNLRIVDGAYKAYGQNLRIQQGELFFTGGLVTNPGINLRAVRDFSNAGSQFSGSNQLFDFNSSNLQDSGFTNNVSVGIQVTGRLNSPKLKLYSSPGGISQSDILSMLILGRPVSQADQAGGQILLAALSSMNLDQGTQGTQLMDQLQKSLGLDFNIGSSSSYNMQQNTVSDSQTLSVGKSLSKRLYISYNMGLLGSNANVLNLKYLLNRFFSIQVNASDSGNGIDVLYTRQKK